MFKGPVDVICDPPFKEIVVENCNSERNGSRDVKWASIYRVACLINDTLEGLKGVTVVNRTAHSTNVGSLEIMSALLSCRLLFDKLKGPALPVKKNSNCFLAYDTPRPPMSVNKKIQPSRSSRLAGYRQHIYECIVLLYILRSHVLFNNPAPIA